MRTLFIRREGELCEHPLKYRSAVSQRFPGEMFTSIILEYVGGAATGIQSLRNDLAIHGPGLEGRAQAAGSQGESIRSPMVGKVLKVHIELGQWVERGQELFVIEAMKMENKIFAKSSGKVAELHALVGQQVSVGHLLGLLRAE